MAPPRPDGGPVVFLSAGEESGDQHGARVARSLRRRWPDVRLLGLGGPRMEAEGVELMAGLDDLAVMGFVEVLAHLPFFWRLERDVRERLRADDVDLVIPIDYPGFNLRLSRHASSSGIPVLYYIAPQVWAWKEGRTRRLARDADHVAVILPFEVPIFEAEGADVTFVGHPLLDRDEPVPDRGDFAAAAGVDPDRPILALFPGSRMQELDRHLDLFLDTARRVQESRPDVQVVAARASSLDPGAIPSDRVVVTTESRALLRHAAAALVKSGTTTLEAALEETPFVTVYKTSPVTFALARRLVKVEYIALANLVAGREVVPEVLQDDATPDRLARELLELLDPESELRARVVEGLAGVRSALGDPGAADRVAAIAGRLLEEPEA